MEEYENYTYEIGYDLKLILDNLYSPKFKIKKMNITIKIEVDSISQSFNIGNDYGSNEMIIDLKKKELVL